MSLQERVEKIFSDTEALINGHFVLSSGLHSSQYLQCAKVLQWPRNAELCATMLANLISQEKPDLVVSPATGAIIIGQELGRNLGCRAIFVERKNDVFRLRRGFEIHRNEKTLIAEDVVTTGGSTHETITLVKTHGATVMGVASIIDRSSGQALPGITHHSLWSLDIPTFQPEECPLCKSGSKPYKPGSRI